MTFIFMNNTMFEFIVEILFIGKALGKFHVIIITVNCLINIWTVFEHFISNLYLKLKDEKR